MDNIFDIYSAKVDNDKVTEWEITRSSPTKLTMIKLLSGTRTCYLPIDIHPPIH